MKMFFNVVAALSLFASANAFAGNGKAYQLSEKGNCKLMYVTAFGSLEYSNHLADESYCYGLTNRQQYATFEYSKKGNCKRMIDGQFSGQLVDDGYCY